MSTPRNHHFVPAFYLRQWAVGNPQKLVEYSIKHHKLISKLVGPDATGYEYDLYAFNALPPNMEQFLEKKFFDYVDRTSAEALAYHLAPYNRSAWTNDTVSAWARFINALLTRHPDTMPELRVAMKRIWEKSGIEMQECYERERSPEDPATLDEYLALLDPYADAKMQMNLLIQAFDNEISCQRLVDMQWNVVDVSAASYRLITSDRPVCFDNLDKPNGFLAVPISPTQLFVAVNHKGSLDKLRAMPANEIAKCTNQVVAWRARKYVWAHDRSQDRFIKNHMSKKMETLPLLPALARL